MPNPLSQRGLARHHTIPAWLFLAFYTKALSVSNPANYYYEERRLFALLSHLARDGLDFYQFHSALRVPNITISILTSFNNTARYEDFGMIRNVYYANNTQSIIDNLLEWMPFNIFEGPRNRTDDPGPEFEESAGPILGQELFNQLKAIYDLMMSYIGNATERVFNATIDGLQALASNRTWHNTPYNRSKWEQHKSGKYYIKKENQSNERFQELKRKRETYEGHFDPYCFIAVQYLIDHGDEIYNIVIAGKAFDRVKNRGGFYFIDYDSWKDFYRRNLPMERGLMHYARTMAVDSSLAPYGYKFNDGSFMVGIIGDDVKYGNDNWKTLRGGDWGRGDEYAGEIFFDKIGRPVAIVISCKQKAGSGAGCSFIYNNGKWEYESNEDWDIRRFYHRTLSLDPRAPRFLIDKRDDVLTVDYGRD